MKNKKLQITSSFVSGVITLFLILSVITPANAAEKISLGEKADAMHYRCEIVSVYSRLHRISTEYGEILINENEETIFHASGEAQRAFNGVRKELADMYVPENMKEPHEMLIKSVSTYTQSARSIEKSLGIYIGELEGTDEESLELVEEGEQQVVLANEYLSQSLGMHDKLLSFDEDASKSCRKIVAGI